MYLVAPVHSKTGDKFFKAWCSQQPLYRDEQQQQQQQQTIKKVRKNVSKLLSELKHCVGSRDLVRGRRIHEEAIESGDDTNIYVVSRLVEMYAKCGSLHEAHKAFDGIRRGRDVVLWNTLILGYAENGDGESALQLFASMKDCPANSRTFVAALKACSVLVEAKRDRSQGTEEPGIQLETLEKVMEIHSRAVKQKCDSDIFVMSSLVDVYARCGCLEDARRVFDRSRFHNEVSWNALISGYAENGRAEEALQMILMMESRGFASNARTYIAALKACSCMALNEEASELDDGWTKLRSLEKGMAIQSQATKLGFGSDVFLMNSLLDFYVKCGSLFDARRVFEGMSSRSVVSWNSLMLGHLENEASDAALEIFCQMVNSCCSPDSISFAAAVKACGKLTDYRLGKAVHGWICKAGLETSSALATSLIDFYGRCGCMVSARQVFESIQSVTRDMVSWSCLMSGYGRQGDMDVVWELFDELLGEGLRPDSSLLRTVLAASSHAGGVVFGRDCLLEMEQKYGVAPSLEHYHCVIDLLGRADRLDEALELLKLMPFEATSVTWTMILSACSRWKNTRVGKIAFQALQKLDATQDSGYVLMAGIHESG